MQVLRRGAALQLRGRAVALRPHGARTTCASLQTVDVPQTRRRPSSRTSCNDTQDAPALSVEQRKVLDLALDGASLFIGGEAGSGKTCVLRAIIRELRARSLLVAVTASTGIAALQIDGATFHSTLGLPVDDDDDDDEMMMFSQHHQRSPPRVKVEVFSHMDVLVVDEISMLHAGYVEMINAAARQARPESRDLPFGGIQIILCGDFMQLSPLRGSRIAPTSRPDRFVCRGIHHDGVHPPRRRSSAPTPSQQQQQQRLTYMPAYCSPVFKRALLHVQLQHPHRQGDDPCFMEDLNALRRGALSLRLARSAAINPERTDALRLFSTKRRVRAHNEAALLELPGKSIIFHSTLMLRTVGQLVCEGGKKRLMLSQSCALLAMLRGIGASTTRQMYVDVLAMMEACGLRAGLPTGCVHAAMAATSSRVLHVALRCSGSTRTQAHRRLQDLMEVVRAELRHGDDDVDDGSMKQNQQQQQPKKRRTSSSTMPNVKRRCGLHLLRCDELPPRELAKLLQPLYMRQHRTTLRNNVLWQDKTLKVGCRVMLLRNISSRYVNGALGTVVGVLPLRSTSLFLPAGLKPQQMPYQPHLTTSSSSCRERWAASLPTPIVRMDRDGSIIAVPWLLLPLEGGGAASMYDGGFLCAKVACMPLYPAYAFTVHKVQGTTLDHPVLFDAADWFPCDHLVYVAASRVRRFHQLRMLNLSPSMVSVHRPSLRFSDALPSAHESFIRWQRWKKKKLKSNAPHANNKADVGCEWFWPTWRVRCNNNKT